MLSRDVSQLGELPPCVCPTQCRRDPSLSARQIIKLVVPSVGIGLQDSTEAIKMANGMLMSAIPPSVMERCGRRPAAKNARLSRTTVQMCPLIGLASDDPETQIHFRAFHDALHRLDWTARPHPAPLSSPRAPPPKKAPASSESKDVFTIKWAHGLSPGVYEHGLLRSYSGITSRRRALEPS